MAALDHPPQIACAVVREVVGDKVQLRGRVVSLEAGEGSYSLHIIKSGPAGSSNIQMGGPFSFTAGAETYVGLAHFNVELNARYTTDFSVIVNNQTYNCPLPNGDLK